MSTTAIICRAHLVEDCAFGRPQDPEQSMEDDGTYDGHSIVCDACYCAVMPFTPSGQALNHELPEAIRVYSSNATYLRLHPDPAELVAQAERDMEIARPGSPYHESARACRAMATREVQRRAAEPTTGEERT